MAAERGGRRRGDAGLLQVSDDLGVQPIHSGGLETGRAPSEADDVERDRRHELEPVGLGDACGQVPGLVAVALDGRAEAPCAVLLQREPHLERTKAARQRGPKVAEPGIAAGEAARVAAQIIGRQRECGAMQVAAAHQDAAGVVGHVQPFVEVEGQKRGCALPVGYGRIRSRAARQVRSMP